MSENPYQTPKAEILNKNSDQLPKKSSVAWKIYFWLSLLLAVVTFILFPLTLIGVAGDAFSIYDALDFMIWLPSLLAIFGVAWSRKKLSRKFWRNYLYLFLVWNIFYTFIFTFILGLDTYGVKTTLEDLIYEMPFTLIHLYLLYRYVYKMNYLWDNNEQNDKN